ncbi:MAG: GntR family transcriptional regulator [Marmoricola sp.]|nr:GntR family transcriptional regulator [Marmoricola sp.]
MDLPARDPLPRRLLRDDVLERLRDAVVDGTLAPGAQLRDQELAGWLGVSRTPVREALLRLEQAGLVHTTPGRSTTVATLEDRAVADAQSVVAAMHALAVREGCPRLGERDLVEMRAAADDFAAALGAGDVEAALAADDRLHGVPVRASGNRAVAAVLEQYTPVVRRLERLRFGSLAGRGSVALHDELVAHCAAGRASEAEAVELRTWQALGHLIHLDPPTPGEDPA